MAQLLIARVDENDVQLNFELKENESQTVVVINNGTREGSCKLDAALNRDATLNIYNVVTSNINSNLNEEITLKDKGAYVKVINVLLSGKDAILNSDIMINHLEGNTESDFSTYAISKDTAVLNLNNNATIKKGAAKTIAHQKTKGLTLDKASKIKAMPNLFIDEYDVIANHACSIGSINKEDLFYLMSRGLASKEASKLIVMGFIAPIIDNIDDQNLKEEIRNNFSSKL